MQSLKYTLFLKVFHLQSQRRVLYGGENIFKDECCLLVPDLILSIICGHVFFQFLVVLFLRLFFYSKTKSKNIENFQKTKIFYSVFCFIFLEDYMNYNISLLT